MAHAWRPSATTAAARSSALPCARTWAARWPGIKQSARGTVRVMDRVSQPPEMFWPAPLNRHCRKWTRTPKCRSMTPTLTPARRGWQFERRKAQSSRQTPDLSQYAADSRPAGAAATFLAVADELLQALSGIDFGRVDIPSGIEADLVQPVELASLAPAPPEPSELFERVALQHVARHVGVVADVEAGLSGVGREVHRHRRSRQAVGVDRDELLFHEAAPANLTRRIAAFLAKVRIAAVEHLHAVVAAIADIEQAVLGDLHTVHRRAEERRLHVAFREVVHPGSRGGCRFVVDRVGAVC